MIRAGFVIGGNSQEWLGGTNYLINLIHALHGLPNRSIEPVLIVPPTVTASTLAAFPPVEIIHSSLVVLRSPAKLARKILKSGLGRDYPMENLLRAHNIALLSHSGHLGSRARLPAIEWIPDFQHRRLPEFFQASELRLRDRLFGAICRSNAQIVLSSFAAQQDLVAFEPKAAGKSRVLHFVSGINRPGGARVDLQTLQKRYGFQGPYFHLPNQFWAHKNHRVVIDALAILKNRGRKMIVLATGHTSDQRQPGHYNALMQRVASAGVEEDFRVLGVIPYDDVTALMRHSTAVINPSLFEGWSTTVEEAKSTGKTTVLSDIAVHREQDPPRAVFFDPGNAESLADAMWQVAGDFDVARDVAGQREAADKLPARFQQFAKDYEEIVLELMNKRT